MARYCGRTRAFGRRNFRDGDGANLDSDRQRRIHNIVRGCCDATAGALADLAQNVRANVDQIAFALDCLDCDFDRMVARSPRWGRSIVAHQVLRLAAFAMAAAPILEVAVWWFSFFIDGASRHPDFRRIFWWDI